MSAKIHVLVLEDNPDDLFLLSEMMEASEEAVFHVTEAGRLAEALDVASSSPVDVAVLDLNVPDSFGLDTFLSFHERFPWIPAVIMTGVKDVETAVSAVKHGAQDFLNKDEASTASVARTLRYAIERHGLKAKVEQAAGELAQSLDESRRREAEVQGLLKGARAVLEKTDFQTTARQVFDICSELIGSTSGYVALLSDDGAENEVLFLEAGGLPCTVDPELPMPIRGLREVCYQKNETVFDNSFMESDWVRFMPEGHVRLDNVMFAPLILYKKTVGVMGLANKSGGFTEHDARIASGFGELAAIALQNSRNLDKRDAAEKKNEILIAELKAALANVKQLSGLLPICSHCKKIRDDKGYWKQLEAYIHEHSDATFSHSICRECAEVHYPGMDLYGDS